MNLVHSELDNRNLLLSLTLKQGKSASQIARMMEAPQNSVMHFLKKHLTPDELALVPRERRHFTRKQRMLILLEIVRDGLPVCEVAAKYNINPRQLCNWRRQIRTQVKSKKVSQS